MKRAILECIGASVLLLTSAVFLPGCGGADDTLPRQSVSGTVTFDGQPLKAGMIQFFPLSQTEGVAAGGNIDDGKYDVSQSEGPIPGQYSVMIFRRESTPQAAPVENEMPGEIKRRRPSGPPIPQRYNLNSELRAEVKKEGPNTFDFTLSMNKK